MLSGPAMSRPCAQCSASRVVASVAGFSGSAAHARSRCGSAARSAFSAAILAARQRRKTAAGAARSARTSRSITSSSVAPPAERRARSAPATLAATASSVCARWSTTSAIVHPLAADGDAHSRSSRRPRMASSLSCSATRSSKTTMPGLCHAARACRLLPPQHRGLAANSRGHPPDAPRPPRTRPGRAPGRVLALPATPWPPPGRPGRAPGHDERPGCARADNRVMAVGRSLAHPVRYAVLAAGGLPVLVFPAPNLEFLAWFALVPGLLAMHRSPSAREAAVRGGWFGAGYFLAALWWVAPEIGPALLLVAAAFGALWPGVGLAVWGLL